MTSIKKTRAGGRSKSAPPKNTTDDTSARVRTSVRAIGPERASRKKTNKYRVRFEDRTFGGVHHKSGRLATIREVIASNVPTRTGRDLSLDERVRLATRRIRENDKFVSMMMLGVPGVVDKKKALKEIRELSPIGLHLLEIDMRHGRLQIEQSLAARLKRRKKNDSGNDGRN